MNAARGATNRTIGGSHENGQRCNPRLRGGSPQLERRRRRGSTGQGQGDRVCKNLLGLWRRLLVHPGTDTCVKLGGYVRADVTFNGSIHGQPAWSGDLGQQNRFRDYFVDRSRMALTSTPAPQPNMAWSAPSRRAISSSDPRPNTVNPANFTGSPTAGTNTGLLFQPGEGYVATEYIFLQFAGFTFGKSASAYASPWQGFPGNISSFLLGGQNTDTGVNNIQYTAQFGNGVSGTIGLDHPVVWDRTNVYNLSLPLNATLGGSNVYAGVPRPTSSATFASTSPGACSRFRPTRTRSRARIMC